MVSWYYKMHWILQYRHCTKGKIRFFPVRRAVWLGSIRLTTVRRDVSFIFCSFFKRATKHNRSRCLSKPTSILNIFIVPAASFYQFYHFLNLTDNYTCIVRPYRLMCVSEMWPDPYFQWCSQKGGFLALIVYYTAPRRLVNVIYGKFSNNSLKDSRAIINFMKSILSIIVRS